MHSETDIASGDAISRSVIQQLALWKFPEFLPHFSIRKLLRLPPAKNTTGMSDREILVDEVLRHYRKELSVTNDGRSNTLDIAFSASTPTMAADIANAHAEAYLLEQSTRGSALRTRAIDWLRREVEAQAQELRAADAEVQRYQLKHNIVSANDSTIVEQRLGQLTTQLVDAHRQLSTQTTLLDEVQKLRNGGDAGSAASMISDTSLANLLQTRAQMEASIATLDKRFAPNHPTLVKQREALVGINDALNQHLGVLENQASSAASWWQQQVDALQKAVDEETSRKTVQDSFAVGLPSLLSQAQVKRTVFETVMNRYQTLLAEQVFAAPAATIVEQGVPTSHPSFPKVPLTLVVASAGGDDGGRCGSKHR